MLIMMMMMLNYVNLFVEYIIISVPILFNKDNYCTFILSSYVFIGGHAVILLCTPVALS